MASRLFIFPVFPRVECEGRDFRAGRRPCLPALTTLLTPFDGKTLNKAAIARQLGASRPTIAAWLRLLEGEGLLCLLPFLGGERKPLLWLRSDSFRGSRVRALIARLPLVLPDSQFYWWKTGRVRQIDLVVVTPGERIGFCFSTSMEPPDRDIWPLRIAYRRGIIQRGFVLHTGTRAFITSTVVNALPLPRFLEDLGFWMSHPTKEEAREARGRINAAAVRSLRLAACRADRYTSTHEPQEARGVVRDRQPGPVRQGDPPEGRGALPGDRPGPL